ncbi:MAG TPA: PucR family transcriptional regulator [Pseudonocardia sp.]|jgi:hypothetical protein
MSSPPALSDVQVSVPLRTVVADRALALEVLPETLRPGALDAPVRWAHVCELLDPAPYLLGGELLLITGVNLPGGQRAVGEYVGGLRAAGITALGFGITPSVHERLPATLRRACARHGLPLLVVPSQVPFLAVSRAVSVALTELAGREQLRIHQAREALTSVAADGLDAVAAELAARLPGWVCLLEDDGRRVTGYGAPSVLPAEVTALVVRLRSGSGVRAASTELPDGTVVAAQPVYPQATASRLLIAGRAGRFDPAARAILAVGAALLGPLGGAGADAAPLGAAATGLLLGTAPAAGLIGALLGAGEYRVVVGTRRRAGQGSGGRAGQGSGGRVDQGSGGRVDQETGSRVDQGSRGYPWLRGALDSPFVQLGTDGVGGADRFTAVVGAGFGTAALAHLHGHGWLAAAGPALPAERLAGALAEADLLLAKAHALGRPTLAGTDRLADPADLVPPDVGAEFAARLLDPLHRLDRADLLLDTLRTWLAQHGGWDRTAAALGVHRNSVRHRIGQIERALEVDLADPEVRMRLWFALRWAREDSDRLG